MVAVVLDIEQQIQYYDPRGSPKFANQVQHEHLKSAVVDVAAAAVTVADGGVGWLFGTVEHDSRCTIQAYCWA